MRDCSHRSQGAPGNDACVFNLGGLAWSCARRAVHAHHLRRQTDASQLLHNAGRSAALPLLWRLDCAPHAARRRACNAREHHRPFQGARRQFRQAGRLAAQPPRRAPQRRALRPAHAVATHARARARREPAPLHRRRADGHLQRDAAAGDGRTDGRRRVRVAPRMPDRRRCTHGPSDHRRRHRASTRRSGRSQSPRRANRAISHIWSQA
mmetsp:Transcript_19132/g.41341  ORF Transcript_19132/g.41341 Transcript_19132/m.41341 type:complete len:209 (-) Transcript_19132:851-1477(-)